MNTIRLIIISVYEFIQVEGSQIYEKHGFFAKKQKTINSFRLNVIVHMYIKKNLRNEIK